MTLSNFKSTLSALSNFSKTTYLTKKTSFTTFSLPTKIPSKVLPQSVPIWTLENEVKIEHDSMNYKINAIRLYFKEGKCLPMFMITMPCIDHSKEILWLITKNYVVK